MALQDILAAITAEADKRIADTRAEHQRSLTALREESERNLARKKQEIAVSKQQKMEQLRTKTAVHADTHKRNALLLAKKDILDRVYAKAIDELNALSNAETETLLRTCLKRIATKGVIYPSSRHADLLKKICPSEQFRMEKPTDAKGGFLFVSDTQEQDFTFEYIVEQMIRPEHELATAKILFS